MTMTPRKKFALLVEKCGGVTKTAKTIKCSPTMVCLIKTSDRKMQRSPGRALATRIENLSRKVRLGDKRITILATAWA